MELALHPGATKSRHENATPRLEPAPAHASREQLQAQGVPAVLRIIIEGVWDRRPVVLFGSPEPGSEDLWPQLAQVRTRAHWERWLGLARELSWGTPVPWSMQVENLSLAQQRHARRRARRLLGAPLALWLGEDAGWMQWWAAAESQVRDDNDRLAQRLRVLDQQRRNARPEPTAALPPKEMCTRSSIDQAARALALRFGLRRVEAAAGMPSWCVAEHLAHAAHGLGQLAAILGWKDHEIGAGRLGLGFELGPKDTAASFDPLQHTIFLGRDEGFGSFAHEFGHALDHVGRDRSMRGAFASTQKASDPRNEEHLSPVQQVHARREMILAFGDAYRAWRSQYPASHPGLDPLDQDLAQWLQATLDPVRFQANQRHQWERWAARMTLVLTNAPAAWAAQFEDLCEHARQAWSCPLSLPGWQAWAYAQDRVASSSYWALPHEMWARGFHAFVRYHMPCDGWLADDAARADQYPCRDELTRWNQSLAQQLPLLYQAWISQALELNSDAPL